MKGYQIYKVMENGVELYRGTTQDIGKKFGAETSKVTSDIMSKCRLMKKYDLVGTGEYINARSIYPKPKRSRAKYPKPKEVKKVKGIWRLSILQNN